MAHTPPLQSSLLQCPFCGEPATFTGKPDLLPSTINGPAELHTKVRCSNASCGAAMISMYEEQWNRRSHPPTGASEAGKLVRSKLFQQFLSQGFWHAHHVDLVWRYNGEDVREEADWLKDLWYFVRGKQ